MLNYTSEDKLFDKLALTPITDKRQLRVGDKVKVKYSGWDIEYAFDDNASNGVARFNFRRVVKKTKVECFVNAVVDKDHNLEIIDHPLKARGQSGELKNFKKGWDGTPGVGASWGGTGVGSAFLTNGCKIVGRYQ